MLSMPFKHLHPCKDSCKLLYTVPVLVRYTFSWNKAVSPSIWLQTKGCWLQVEVVGVFRGHTDAVECLAASPLGDSFCSGSWDSSINLWQSGVSNLPVLDLLRLWHYAAQRFTSTLI